MKIPHLTKLRAKIIKDKITILEDKILVKEWTHISCTILEDERPSKNFLSNESQKQGYNKICNFPLKIPSLINTNLVTMTIWHTPSWLV